MYLSDYPRAMEYYVKALAMNEELDNKSGAARVTGNIGIVYLQLSDYSRALEYYVKALAAREELGDKSGAANVTGNIGIVYLNLSDYPRALEYLFKALAAYEELGNKIGAASVTGSIGTVYSDLSDYPRALEYYVKALAAYEELGNKIGAAMVTGSIGAVYSDLSDYPRALEYLFKALAAHEEFGDKRGAASVTGSIGAVYSDLSDYPRALEYLFKALAMHEEIGDKIGAAIVTGNIGLVYSNLSDYPRALEYIIKALAAYEELGDKRGAASVTGSIGNVYSDLSDYPRALEYLFKALAAHEELGNKSGAAIAVCNIGKVYAKEGFDGFDAAKAEEYLLKAISMSEELGTKLTLYESCLALSELLEREERWKESGVYFKKYHDIEKEVQSEEAKKQAEKQDAERKIAIERSRAQEKERILNNILPEEITMRLIKGENPIADSFACVSILFMDIVDFTALSGAVTSRQLVHLLNKIFSACDNVMREYGLEKIKTIGDAYMAVAGAPVAQEDHAFRAASAALKLMEVMNSLVVSFSSDLGDISNIGLLPEIEVRIGLHCGHAVAGVVGENKFLYDLWGDAVNTASRMESHGSAGKIQVSREFMEAALSDKLLPTQFVERGEIEIKGKGLMRTYFLQRPDVVS